MRTRRRTVPPTLLFIVVVVCGAAAGEWYASLAEGSDEVVCQVPAAEPRTEPRWKTKQGGAGDIPLARLADVPEASGLALSHRAGGILWTFNDSDDPTLYAIDREGHLKGQVHVTGAATKNWEDVSWGPCGRGSCLYVADIGDNHARRSQITVYRVREPLPGDKATAPAEALVATYPDFPHDAEALFVTPDERLFIVTKDKPATVYRFPQPVQAGRVMTLQEVALLPMEDVTDAETSPDGYWVGIRTKEEMIFFRREQLTSGGTDHGTPINLRGLHEPQGEGIAIAGDGTVYVAGEGGGKHAPGTFAAVKCRFPRP
jgi:hypothetical protein